MDFAKLSDVLYRFARHQNKELVQWSTTEIEGEYELLLSDNADDVFAPIESVIVSVKYNKLLKEAKAIRVR